MQAASSPKTSGMKRKGSSNMTIESTGESTVVLVCLFYVVCVFVYSIFLKPFSNARLLFEGKDAFNKMKKEITAANKLMEDGDAADDHPQLLCLLMP